jgi:hypothetical protein
MRVTGRQEFEARLGRLVLWALVYGVLACVVFIVADWLLGSSARKVLGGLRAYWPRWSLVGSVQTP